MPGWKRNEHADWLDLGHRGRKEEEPAGGTLGWGGSPKENLGVLPEVRVGVR